MLIYEDNINQCFLLLFLLMTFSEMNLNFGNPTKFKLTHFLHDTVRYHIQRKTLIPPENLVYAWVSIQLHIK